MSLKFIHPYNISLMEKIRQFEMLQKISSGIPFAVKNKCRFIRKVIRRTPGNKSKATGMLAIWL